MTTDTSSAALLRTLDQAARQLHDTIADVARHVGREHLATLPTTERSGDRFLSGQMKGACDEDPDDVEDPVYLAGYAFGYDHPDAPWTRSQH